MMPATRKGEEKVTPTQLLLNYMNAVEGREDSKKLFFSMYVIANGLDKKNIHTSVFFRGCLDKKEIYSEILSNELWYWRSNELIKDSKDSFINYIEYTEKGKGLFMDEKFKTKLNLNLSSKY